MFGRESSGLTNAEVALANKVGLPLNQQAPVRPTAP
jgi:tRNA C32,U32 (ribose-2'-O)-methylase TrmJ